MSDKDKDNSQKKSSKDPSTIEKGYKPTGGATGGYQPDKSRSKPVNPPKKK